MSNRILIISDTHLGGADGAATSPETLRPLWQKVSRLVINGDVAEIHHPQACEEAARQTLRLNHLCEQDGVALTLLSGNHDVYLTDVRHLQLAGGQVLVTHGDALHPGTSPWGAIAKETKRGFVNAISRVERKNRDKLAARLNALQHTGLVIRGQLDQHYRPAAMLELLIKPWLVLKVWSFWRNFPTLANEFARRHAPQTRFMVLGHSHRQGIWHRDGRVILNTGSFAFPGRPRAVTLEDRQLHVWPIRQRNGAYQLGRESIAEYEVLPVPGKQVPPIDQSASLS